ncbi:MAG TPA: hypothetical protein VFX60_05010 [Micromonospora sp.]|nr:hypothetical protein [Micromonospora sp.]
MTQDQSAHPQQQTAVIAWDGSEVLRGGWPRLFGGLRRQRWVVPGMALLGAVALFASLVAEWQITRWGPRSAFRITPDETGEVGVGIAWVNGWSAPYLMGLFAVASCLALVLFGPRPAREYLRIAGIAVCGLLLAVLVAITIDLKRSTALFGGMYSAPIHEHLEVSHGPGLVAAFAGVVCVALALLLAGRPAPAPASGSSRPEPAAADREAATAEDDWSWRRPGRVSAELPEHQPFDLAVGPTAPFVPLDEEDRR